MSSSLSSLVDNFAEGLHNDKCTDCKSYLEYISTKDNQSIYKCLKCSKNHNKEFNKDLIKRFANTYEFCDEDINKFCLMLRKEIYPYECMDSWKRFGEILLPNKIYFYSSLNIEDITDADYKHVKKVRKDFEITNLGKYHDLFVQSDTLLLADLFENF